MEKYYKAVENKICKMCIDAKDDGTCTLTEEEKCAVKIFLPEIIKLVHESNSDNFDHLYKKLKDEVCIDCKARNEEGFCYLKDDSNCSLDRYFTTIVETIKNVDSGKI